MLQYFLNFFFNLILIFFIEERFILGEKDNFHVELARLIRKNSSKAECQWRHTFL